MEPCFEGLHGGITAITVAERAGTSGRCCHRNPKILLSVAGKPLRRALVPGDTKHPT